MIDAIRDGKRPASMDREVAAVYTFCNELLTTKQVSDATLQSARKFLGGDRGVVDLVATLGVYQLVAMTMVVDSNTVLVAGRNDCCKQGARWVIASGGVRPRRGRNLQGRYLCFAEREEIALARAAGESMRSIAARLGRSPSTISRELGRNAEAPGGIGRPARMRRPGGACRAAETGEAGDEPGVAAAFAATDGRAALMPYLMGGFPDLDASW